MHDGAVIIRGDRILAGGCVLPLSDSPRAVGLGTRHRAAIGITEQTDAACIVVSEETGSVSVARAGNLMQHIRLERLAQYLQVFYRTDIQEPPILVAGGR
jgi:diadenylate cyclase